MMLCVDVVMDKKVKGGGEEAGEVLERCTRALLPQPAKKNPTEDHRQYVTNPPPG